MNAEAELSHQPKVLTESEIEAMLHGDRRGIDKMLLTQINGLSAAFIGFRYRDFPEHAEHEEKLHRSMSEILSELGTKEEVRARIAFIDAAAKAANERSKLFSDLRSDLAKHTMKGLIGVLLFLIGYWWATSHGGPK
jgi:hypothetical protein